MSILKNKSGFSLVELMVTVAVIGILAFVAAPQYSTFQAKARQKEGFALMNAYYSAAQQTFAYFEVYPGNFVATDFNPQGQLGYRLRTEDNINNIGVQDNDDACISTGSACDCGGAGCIEYRRGWQEKPAGAQGLRLGPQSVVAACPPLADLHVSDTTFSIRIGGVISTNSANIDRYGMDQNKQVIACSDGLK